MSKNARGFAGTGTPYKTVSYEPVSYTHLQEGIEQGNHILRDLSKGETVGIVGGGSLHLADRCV